jgi:hypothetical protein
MPAASANAFNLSNATSLARPSSRRPTSSPSAAAAGLRPPTRQAGETREHGLGLLESNVRDIAAVASVPAERRAPELSRLVDQQEHELKGIREAHEVELRSCRERDRRVAAIECTA